SALSSVFARALEGAKRKHPVTSPTIAQSWIDVTPSDLKETMQSGDCGLATASPTTLPRALGEAKDPLRLTAPSCISVPTSALHAVAATDVGFVVVGEVEAGGPTDVAWFSPDGRAWSHVPEGNGLGQTFLADVIAGGPGFLAAGADESGMPAAWYSADGVTWTRADISLPSDLNDVDVVWGVIPT